MLISEKRAIITTISRTSTGIVTAILDKLPQQVQVDTFVAGKKVAITSVENPDFNGRFPISEYTGPPDYHLLYSQPGLGASSSGGGMARSERKIMLTPAGKIVRSCCNSAIYTLRLQGELPYEGVFWSHGGLNGKCLRSSGGHDFCKQEGGVLSPSNEVESSLNTGGLALAPNGFGIIAGSRNYITDQGKFLKIMYQCGKAEEICIAWEPEAELLDDVTYEQLPGEIKFPGGMWIKWVPNTMDRFILIRGNSPPNYPTEGHWQLAVSMIKMTRNPIPPAHHFTIDWTDTIDVYKSGVFSSIPGVDNWCYPDKVGGSGISGITASIFQGGVKVFIFHDYEELGPVSALNVYTYDWEGHRSDSLDDTPRYFGWAGADWDGNIWTYYGGTDDTHSWRLYKNGAEFLAPGMPILYLTLFDGKVFIAFYHTSAEVYVLRCFDRNGGAILWTRYYDSNDFGVQTAPCATKSTCRKTLSFGENMTGHFYEIVCYADNGGLRCAYGPQDDDGAWIMSCSQPIAMIVTNCLATVVDCDPPEEGKKRCKIRVVVKGNIIVLDDYGYEITNVQKFNPIEGVSISYSFTGAIEGDGVMTTDEHGIAETYTPCTAETGIVTFQIDEISGEGYFYNEDENILSGAECVL